MAGKHIIHHIKAQRLKQFVHTERNNTIIKKIKNWANDKQEKREAKIMMGRLSVGRCEEIKPGIITIIETRRNGIAQQTQKEQHQYKGRVADSAE